MENVNQGTDFNDGEESESDPENIDNISFDSQSSGIVDDLSDEFFDGDSQDSKKDDNDEHHSRFEDTDF
jgi:hypothetical protein